MYNERLLLESVMALHEKVCLRREEDMHPYT